MIKKFKMLAVAAAAADMPATREATLSRARRLLQVAMVAPGMYCRQPLSSVASSRPIQQVRCAIGRVRTQ